MSLKDAIAKAVTPRVVDSEIEVNGEQVKLRFRALKYPERKAIFQAKFVEVGKDAEGRPISQIPAGKIGDLNAEFIAATLVDEEDNALFSKEDILKGWDTVTADKIADAGMRALGMTGTKKEDEENPSTPSP